MLTTWFLLWLYITFISYIGSLRVSYVNFLRIRGHEVFFKENIFKKIIITKSTQYLFTVSIYWPQYFSISLQHNQSINFSNQIESAQTNTLRLICFKCNILRPSHSGDDDISNLLKLNSRQERRNVSYVYFFNQNSKH